MTRAPTNVTPYRMTAKFAETKIRELAQNSSNIIWAGHCAERSEERGITFMDALVVLRGGTVTEVPVKGNFDGEWKCKVVKNLRGNRDAGVITIIMTKQEKLKIKTVEWEDLR